MKIKCNPHTADPAMPIVPHTSNKLAWLKKPWMLLLGIFMGGWIGYAHPELGRSLAFPGSLYLALLQLSVLPLVSTSIIVGLARMLRSGSAQYYLGNMVLLFAVSIITCSALGLGIGFWLEPGINLGRASEAFIGQALLDKPASDIPQAGGLSDLLTQLIPANPFYAFSSGKMLGIVFVSILIGWAIGLSQSLESERFLQVIEGMQEVFNRILSAVLYGLSFGVFFMIAGHVSVLGMDALLAMAKFLWVVSFACLILCGLYIFMIRLSSGAPFRCIVTALSHPVLIAFPSVSAIAAIPTTQRSLKSDLKQPPDVVDFVVPLSVAMNRQAYVLLFALTTVFITQLFGKPLDLQQTLFVMLAAPLVGMAAAGRLITAGPMIAYVLIPLDLPANVAITLFLTIGTILDPIIQSTLIIGSCANASVLGKKLRLRQREN
jgi:proton glutamate symport protein